ncbi:MAG: LamG domain-containing protein [Planctomycetota bacterium]|jgi:hypothetical protein
MEISKIQKNLIALVVVMLPLCSGVSVGTSSCWKFNEGGGNTAFDSSGHAHATVRGNPLWSTGSFGMALHLDGDGDYLDVGLINWLSSEQTKMLWVCIESFPPDGVYLIDEGGDGNNNWIELYDAEGDGNPQVRAGFDSFNYIDGKTEIRPGYWYHIAVATRLSGRIAIYVNGVLDSSASDLSADNPPESVVIGTDSGTRTGCFSGLIDEVQIHGTFMPPGQIRKTYSSGVERYRRAHDNARLVIQSLEQAIADREQVVAGLDKILDRARVTTKTVSAFLETDYNPLTNEGSEVITAGQKIRAAQMHLEQSRASLATSIEQLSGVLRQLENEFEHVDRATAPDRK